MNLMVNDSRFVNTARAVTITSGEIYPLYGKSTRARWTRPVVDKRSFGSAGNGMERNLRDFKLGADPPKNPSGRAGVGRLQL
jgi:hypothetical protein